MSLYSDRQQANPAAPDTFEEMQLRAKADRIVRVLDANGKSIRRWFWKALLALNLVLWSCALPLAFLLR